MPYWKLWPASAGTWETSRPSCAATLEFGLQRYSVFQATSFIKPALLILNLRRLLIFNVTSWPTGGANREDGGIYNDSSAQVPQHPGRSSTSGVGEHDVDRWSERESLECIGMPEMDSWKQKFESHLGVSYAGSAPTWRLRSHKQQGYLRHVAFVCICDCACLVTGVHHGVSDCNQYILWVECQVATP